MSDATCRKIQPFYLRRSSGERLCQRSLEKSLIKHVKRSFREIKKVKPGSTLCVFVPPGKVLEGTALHLMLSYIERNYGSFVVSFFPNCFREARNKILKIASGLSNSRVLYYDEEVSDFHSLLELIDYSVNVATFYCNKTENKLPILLPFTLTDIVEGFIDLMILQKSINGMGSFNKLLSNLRYLLPFNEILRSDILAYAYSKGFLEALDLCPVILANGVRQISNVVAELELKHSELLYSTLKSVNQLINVSNKQSR